jgi:hypothetical protein
MNHEHQPTHFESPDEKEMFALELRWYEGRMLPYSDWLMAFVDRHREEILRVAKAPRDPAALLAATKQLIVQRGSIHMGSELKDQKHEIQNELWYRGEKGEYDRVRIEQQWTAAHAAAWRSWRIKEYLFVADRCADRVVALLLHPA